MELDLFSQPAPRKKAERELAAEPRVWSVAELTRSIRTLLESSLGEVWVEGEICNLRRQSSGHVYFGLKDERALLSCVLFRSSVPVQLALAEGMLVQARGRITVYEVRGQYQMTVNLIQPAGAGLLQARFEALKRKLEAEGLFDPARKRAIPSDPSGIGIVTSPTGAALQDFLNIARRRAPWVRMVINPVRVQGVGAAAAIAAAIREFNSPALAGQVDMIVVCRGGGSVEDLWAFNEEIVARAIAASALPVISAVGHEIDFTIADFVADLRAPTPSAAAELALPDRAALLRHVGQAGSRLHRALRGHLLEHRRALEGLARAIPFRFPERILQERAQRLDHLSGAIESHAGSAVRARREKMAGLGAVLRQHRPDQVVKLRRLALDGCAEKLRTAMRTELTRKFGDVARLEGALRLLSPVAIMNRGYSITLDSAGAVVRRVAGVRRGEKVRTRLADGTFDSKVV